MFDHQEDRRYDEVREKVERREPGWEDLQEVLSPDHQEILTGAQHSFSFLLGALLILVSVSSWVPAKGHLYVSSNVQP